MIYFSGLHWNDDAGKYDMAPLVDDIVYGACNNHTGNTRVPVNQLITVMSHLSLLSTRSIQDMLSKRRVINNGDVIGERYCRTILAACENLIESLGYYINKGQLELDGDASFIFDVDAKSYHKYRYSPSCSVISCPFTQGERESIRRLSSLGMLSNIERLIDDANEKYSRWIGGAMNMFKQK